MEIHTLAFALIVLVITGYAVFDGFDLGVGALTLLARSKEERDLYVASISRVWDGNQVWLLSAVIVLFGAFPIAFSTVFSGFYFIFMLLLAGLISRAVAIEFRLMHASPGWIRFWNGAFSFGGIFSALLLGVAFGNIMRGLVIEANFVYHGGIIELFNPYAVLIGLVACAIFILHGAIYLWIKTEDEEPAERLRSIALNAYGVFLLLYGAAVIFTVQVSPFLFRKAGSLAFVCLAILLAVVLAAIPMSIRVHWKRAAFSASAATIALIITGTAYAAWPVLVPARLETGLSLTIYNAAATPETLRFILIVALAGLPIVMGYTFAVYLIFKGPPISY